MRDKVRAARPVKAGRFDVKHSAGGMMDVEFAVQYLVLAHGAAHPELLDNVGNIALLQRAEACGLLPARRRHRRGRCLPRAAPRPAPGAPRRAADAVRARGDGGAARRRAGAVARRVRPRCRAGAVTARQPRLGRSGDRCSARVRRRRLAAAARGARLAARRSRCASRGAPWTAACVHYSAAAPGRQPGRRSAGRRVRHGRARARRGSPGLAGGLAADAARRCWCGPTSPTTAACRACCMPASRGRRAPAVARHARASAGPAARRCSALCVKLRSSETPGRADAAPSRRLGHRRRPAGARDRRRSPARCAPRPHRWPLRAASSHRTSKAARKAPTSTRWPSPRCCCAACCGA